MHVHRIAILLQSLEAGGAQRRVIELANGFVRHGREVDLFLIEQEGRLRSTLSNEVRTFPVQELFTYLRRTAPDAFLSGASAVHSLAVRSVPHHRTFPMILRASSHPYRRLPWRLPQKRFVESLRRAGRIRTYSSADLIIAVANDIAEALRKALPASLIEVIPNQVITDEFLSGRAATVEYPWPDSVGVPLILGIGRLALAKDYPTLLRAFALVRASRPARLAIVGSGSEAERGHLLALAKKLGIENDFALVGDCEHVASWLEHANLFVLSSLWEGAPSTLIEALAVGCPAVATNSVGVARELLADAEVGFLVPASRPRLMADAMLAALKKSFDRERLRATVQTYGSDRVKDYLSVIDHCAERFSLG